MLSARFNELQAPRIRIFLKKLSLLLPLLVLLMGCDPASTARSLPASTVTVIHGPAPLPLFTDWRAAYLDKQSLVHAIKFDGTNDITGPSLPNLDQSGLDLGSFGFISPNGMTLSYAAPSLNIVDLTGALAPRYYPQITALYKSLWFHDSSKVVVTDDVGGYWIVNNSGGAPIAVPGGPFTTRTILDGWIDTTHLAVSGYGPQAQTDADKPSLFYIDALDITTGHLQPVVTIHNQALGIARAILSDDGMQALFVNTPFRDDPFTPMVSVVNMATGAITSLPHMTQLTHASFTTIAWKPGTQTIAVSTGFYVNHNLHSWLLDLQHDNATPLIDGQYPLLWSPDTKALAVSTGLDSTVGNGPYTLSMITFTKDGHPILTQLTKEAMSVPFVGFIRTASS